LNDYRAACDVPAEASVRLAGADGADDQVETTDGVARWSRVPTGPVTITVDAGDRRERAVVFCDGRSRPLELDDGAAEVRIRAGETVTCDWFLVR
jgi:hypothetical protein